MIVIYYNTSDLVRHHRSSRIPMDGETLRKVWKAMSWTTTESPNTRVVVREDQKSDLKMQKRRRVRSGHDKQAPSASKLDT
ncbi:hypothetical protein BDR03DRAFT_941993, partial [Suillus americanus]